jgi:hypothetical protein
MAQEYRVFFLTPGQQSPEGNTGFVLSNGGMIWIGEEGDFPAEATLGYQTSGDIEPETTYDNRLATEDEIDEYENRPEGPLTPPQ